MREVVVVGAGVSGLSVAYRLKKKGIDVVVYEKDGETGGTVKTVRKEGFLYELGPQTLMADEKVLDFVTELGLKYREASPSSRYRYIYKKGKLIPLPLKPQEFITSPLLSFRGKLAVLKDFFQRPVEEDIPIAQFIRNHFGEEVLNYIVSPFLSGVYAGDPEKLSLKYATPKLYEIQRKYGSLLKALFKEKRFAPKGKLLSFSGGLSELVNRLKENLEINTEAVVLRIRKKEEKFLIETRKGKLESKALVIASPAYTSSYLLKEISFSASEEFEKIDYPPIVVVNLGVKGNIPEGFGFLVPRVEGKRILGVMFMSKLFPERAPEGWELLTVFLGGATDREVMELTEEEILKTVKKELGEILTLEEVKPLEIFKWKRAIPQYNVGYGKVLELAKSLEREFPGLFLTGNWLYGVSMGDTIRASEEVARKVEDFLRS